MEFSTEHWASHGKGERTRAEILAKLEGREYLEIEEISASIGKCQRQTKRQLSNLIASGKVERSGNRYFSA